MIQMPQTSEELEAALKPYIEKYLCLCQRIDLEPGPESVQRFNAHRMLAKDLASQKADLTDDLKILSYVFEEVSLATLILRTAIYRLREGESK